MSERTISEWDRVTRLAPGVGLWNTVENSCPPRHHEETIGCCAQSYPRQMCDGCPSVYMFLLLVNE